MPGVSGWNSAFATRIVTSRLKASQSRETGVVAPAQSRPAASITTVHAGL
ncbi:hypothetical protein CPCC7001_195 [Cyanobium sp. PCC 7001]|nr:hypothetical protein CPCC7001_195 [Cyanobium sp. PCC 7001]